MGNEEMLSTFDVLYNNITSNQAPGLNIYEISLLLTRAENEIVKNYFTPKGNRYQEGYDGSPKRQSDFSKLVCNKPIREEGILLNVAKLDQRSHVFLIPDEVFLMLNEEIREYRQVGNLVEYGSVYTVVPLAYDEYSRLMQKPYKWPLKNQFWRLTSDGYSELIGRADENYELEYFVRYVRRPKPIILGNLAEIDDTLKIEGQSDAQECELPEHLHMEIVQRAVELAKLIWAGDINATIEAGQRSE